MIDRFIEVLASSFCYQTDRLLTVILCILALIVLFRYSHILVSKRGRTLFWIGCILCVIGVGLTVGLYLWRPSRGLSGSYYDNPSWSGDPVDSMRYFETPGQRVDRFIDFTPNDFNDRYPFSGKPFSVTWQGHVDIPDDGYQLGVRSNFGTWLYVDDTLVEGPHNIDFGTSEARKYLREGWFDDEQWGGNTSTNFVWSSGNRSEFYLGVDELSDYQLSFRCRPFLYEGSPPQELTVSINGTPLKTIILEDGWNTYSIEASRSRIQEVAPGFFRVRFTYSNVVRPADVVTQSGDKRQLAVAFDFAALQKLSKSTPATQEIFPPQALSQGRRRITLHAQSNGIDPFIQLVWKQEPGRDG